MCVFVCFCEFECVFLNWLCSGCVCVYFVQCDFLCEFLCGSVRFVCVVSGSLFV